MLLFYYRTLFCAYLKITMVYHDSILCSLFINFYNYLPTSCFVELIRFSCFLAFCVYILCWTGRLQTAVRFITCSYMHELNNISAAYELPFMVQVTVGSLQYPSAPHVIFATPVRSNPILHD